MCAWTRYGNLLPIVVLWFSKIAQKHVLQYTVGQIQNYIIIYIYIYVCVCTVYSISTWLRVYTVYIYIYILYIYILKIYWKFQKPTVPNAYMIRFIYTYKCYTSRPSVTTKIGQHHGWGEWNIHGFLPAWIVTKRQGLTCNWQCAVAWGHGWLAAHNSDARWLLASSAPKRSKKIQNDPQIPKDPKRSKTSQFPKDNTNIRNMLFIGIERNWNWMDWDFTERLSATASATNHFCDSCAFFCTSQGGVFGPSCTWKGIQRQLPILDTQV